MTSLEKTKEAPAKGKRRAAPEKKAPAKKKDQIDSAVWPDPTEVGPGLIPKSIVATRAVRDFQFRITAAAVIIAIIAVLGWGLLKSGALTGSSAQANEEAQTAGLQQELTELQQVSRWVGGFDVRREAVAQALAQEVFYSRPMDELRREAGPVTISGIATQFGAPCKGPDPFVVPRGIGCMQLTGSAASQEQVTAFVQRLIENGTDPQKSLLLDPYTTAVTTNSSGVGVTFQMTVNYGYPSLSDRYSKYLTGIEGNNR